MRRRSVREKQLGASQALQVGRSQAEEALRLTRDPLGLIGHGRHLPIAALRPRPLSSVQE